MMNMTRKRSLKQCTVSEPKRKKSETEGRSCKKSSDKASTVSKPKRIRTSSRKKTDTVSKPEGIRITLSSPVLIPRK
jgi:hypothetical protein